VRPALTRIALGATLFAAGCASAGRTLEPDLCPVCNKPLADGPEVRVVRAGESEPGTRYRCFLCPIMQGKTGDTWMLRSASGVDGRPVTFRVDGERIAADPPTAVVLALPVEPGAECLDVHRVFADEGEFRRYVDAHPALKDARPRRLDEVLAEHRQRP
jgi:hypothetical protein